MAMANDINPLSTASCPSDGPTTSDCIISADAGNLPARSTLAISLVSLTVKEPVISVLPPDITPLAPGAVYTLLSNTIAIPVSYTHLRAHETDSYLVCR